MSREQLHKGHLCTRAIQESGRRELVVEGGVDRSPVAWVQ